ncbi:MAG TPA: OmpA family protein [Pseudonocardia sp.]|nr:OmpA family protein [Pseudonocardia sp.]
MSSRPVATAPGTATPAGGNGGGGELVAASSLSNGVFEGRNVRLVRSSSDELALQFELHNRSTTTAYAPTQWLDPRTRRLLLFDLPRGVSYQALGESSDPGYRGAWGRMSHNWDAAVEPGGSSTLTAVFAAPPTEATTLLVAIGDLIPVQVPIQPAGSPTLLRDPILGDHHNDPNSGPLVCAAAQQGGPTEFRLPADVLFAFDSATLSPAAQTALDALVKQVNGTAGTVTVQGNTDAIGTDAYNQTLSEQRAAAVADALKPRLGGNFTYSSVGFGKTRPVAPNANPDGSDNPDGRAQNRRVDVEVTTTNPAPPTPASPASAAVQGNLKATVLNVRRAGGYLMTTLQIANPDPAPGTLAYDNTATVDATKRALSSGELAVLDTTGKTRGSLCIPGGTPNTYFSYTASMTTNPTIPAGGTLTLWGITPAPPADTTTVNVQIGGFPDPAPAPITPGP